MDFLFPAGIGSPFDSNHPKALYENIVYEKGIMIIAAAGNNFEDQPLYPARYESVIAVGGVGENGAPWENSAQRVEFVGPAVDVPTITMKEELAANGTTLSNQTEIVNGTGSASASVAAAAGLVWSHFEECTNEQIRLVLARTADNRKELQREGGVSDSKPENDEQLGYGLPQVLDAYNALSKWGCDLSGIDEPTPAPTFEGTPGATGETGAPTSTSGVISTTKVVMNVWCIGVWGVLLAFFTF